MTKEKVSSDNTTIFAKREFISIEDAWDAAYRLFLTSKDLSEDEAITICSKAIDIYERYPLVIKPAQSRDKDFKERLIVAKEDYAIASDTIARAYLRKAGQAVKDEQKELAKDFICRAWVVIERSLEISPSETNTLKTLEKLKATNITSEIIENWKDNNLPEIARKSPSSVESSTPSRSEYEAAKKKVNLEKANKEKTPRQIKRAERRAYNKEVMQREIEKLTKSVMYESAERYMISHPKEFERQDWDQAKKELTSLMCREAHIRDVTLEESESSFSEKLQHAPAKVQKRDIADFKSKAPEVGAIAPANITAQKKGCCIIL
jgi:hypothetical protein